MAETEAGSESKRAFGTGGTKREVVCETKDVEWRTEAAGGNSSGTDHGPKNSAV